MPMLLKNSPVLVATHYHTSNLQHMLHQYLHKAASQGQLKLRVVHTHALPQVLLEHTVLQCWVHCHPTIHGKTSVLRNLALPRSYTSSAGRVNGLSEEARGAFLTQTQLCWVTAAASVALSNCPPLLQPRPSTRVVHSTHMHT
jgi:hypothetical protein